MLRGEDDKVEEWRTAVGADLVATSLSQALERCVNEAREQANRPVGLPVGVQKAPLLLRADNPACDRPGCEIGTECFRAIDAEEFSQPGTRTVDAALDSPNRALRYLRRLLVGHAGCSNQHQSLALMGREQIQCLVQILHVNVPLLGWAN
jgi:hypothetical protein